MVGDAKETLAALLGALRAEGGPVLPSEGLRRDGGWRKRMGALESITADPIQPQYLMACINRLATDDAILTSDSGTIATWAARQFEIRGERRVLPVRQPGHHGARAPVHDRQPVAYPGRQCIAFVGDGGFAMLMAEFATACRYGLPIKVIDQQQSSLGQIMWEQLVLGYPEFGIRFEQRRTSRPGPRRAAAVGLQGRQGRGA